MRFLKWFIGFIVVIGLLLSLAPFAAKRFLVHSLESRGYQAQIKHLGMDFIFGEVTLYDVELRDAEGDGLKVFSAELDVRLLPLLKGRLVIDEATIDSAHIDGRMQDGTLFLGGFDTRRLMAQIGEDKPIEISTASLVNTELCHDLQARCLRIESASVSDAHLSRTASGWRFQHGGPLIMQKAFLRDQSANTTLFYGGELGLAEGNYAMGAIDVKGARLQNIQFIESDLDEGVADAPYQTQIGELLISTLQWRRRDDAVRLELGTVEATSLRQAVQRNKNGELLLPKRVQQWLQELAASFAADNVEMQLQQLEARDGALAWADYSVSPPAMERLSAVQWRLGSLDTSLPDAKATLAVSGKIGRDGSFKFTGSVAPFAKAATFDVSGLVESLDVERISGYTRTLLNQRVNEGVVDVAIEALAQDGQVNASTRWQWSDFDIEPAREESRFMPLEHAYDLLKDHNNSLRFSLDIAGLSGSDQLSPQYILGTQARQVLSEMARGQVGASGTAVVRSAATTERVAFAPLYYPVNARYPEPKDQQRLAELAAMLKQKPHLKMRFCPVVTGAEWAQQYNQEQAANDNQEQAANAATQLTAEQRQSLLQLAVARGKALQATLMDQGVAANQISVCEPRVDVTQSGPSFVTMAL